MFSQCQECKKEFKHKACRSQKFCSRECYDLFYEKKRTFQCTHCTKSYVIQKQAKKPKGIKTFCSRKCMANYQIGENNVSWKGIKKEKHCKECNKSFVIKSSQRINSASFCSYQCKTFYFKKNGWPKFNQVDVVCSTCKILFKRKLSIVKEHNFCSRKCASVYHSSQIRGDKNGRYVHGQNETVYPPGWTKTYKEIIRKRDDGICKLCNNKPDHTLHVHHIDYIKENLDSNNLISLCKYCHGKMHGSISERNKWKEKLLNLLKE